MRKGAASWAESEHDAQARTDREREREGERARESAGGQERWLEGQDGFLPRGMRLVANVN
jgi:hypothetical protein